MQKLCGTLIRFFLKKLEGVMILPKDLGRLDLKKMNIIMYRYQYHGGTP